MWRSWANRGLLLCSLLIVCLPIREFVANRAVTDEFERITLALREFDVRDPNKAYFRAVETANPLRFAWRVYLPKNTWLYNGVEYPRRGGGGGGGGAQTEPARQSILRFNVESYSTSINTSMSFGSGSSTGGKQLDNEPNDSPLRRLADPSVVEIRQLGIGTTIEVELGQTVNLLHFVCKSSDNSVTSEPLMSFQVAPVAIESYKDFSRTSVLRFHSKN